MFVFPVSASTVSASSATRRPAAARLLDQLFSERVSAPAAQARVPAMDVAETDTTYTLAFDVAGATREQLKVSVQGRRVVLDTAEAPADPAADDGRRVLYRERAPARYARTVVLPAEVDAGSASAKVEHGVLTLTLAKKVATGATQIAIG